MIEGKVPVAQHVRDSMVKMRLEQILNPRPGTLSAQWHAADALFYLTGDEKYADLADNLQAD